MCKLTVHILFFPANSLFLVGGARSPGASLLLGGRQVFLFAHGTAAPRLTAIDRRHWATAGKTHNKFQPYTFFFFPLTGETLWKFQVFALTSYCPQSGYDPRAGRRGSALTPLSLPLVHTRRCLDCDLMLKAFRWASREKGFGFFSLIISFARFLTLRAHTGWGTWIIMLMQVTQRCSESGARYEHECQ